MKLCINMSLFFPLEHLCWHFCLRLYSFSYSLSTQRRDLLDFPISSKMFPNALFLLIPCVAADMLGHPLSKPFF